MFSQNQEVNTHIGVVLRVTIIQLGQGAELVATIIWILNLEGKQILMMFMTKPNYVLVSNTPEW